MEHGDHDIEVGGEQSQQKNGVREDHRPGFPAFLLGGEPIADVQRGGGAKRQYHTLDPEYRMIWQPRRLAAAGKPSQHRQEGERHRTGTRQEMIETVRYVAGKCQRNDRVTKSTEVPQHIRAAYEMRLASASPISGAAMNAASSTPYTRGFQT